MLTSQVRAYLAAAAPHMQSGWHSLGIAASKAIRRPQSQCRRPRYRRFGSCPLGSGPSAADQASEHGVRGWIGVPAICGRR